MGLECLTGVGEVPEEEYGRGFGTQIATGYLRRGGEAVRGQGKHRLHRVWSERQGSYEREQRAACAWATLAFAAPRLLNMSWFSCRGSL